MRRNFGPINHNNAPPGGYQRFVNEQPNWPVPPRILARQAMVRSVITEQTAVLEADEMAVETGPPVLEDLPVSHFEKRIVESVKNNQVIIIDAETGAGKSTRVPQMLHNAGWKKVYLTQPRRAAARNVYGRIADEFETLHGTSGRELVSYRTADEQKGPDNAPVEVITDGIQLARELNGSGVTENQVIIVDEVHEGNANVEIVLACAKRAIARNPNIRLIIMSATVDATPLVDYFAEVCPARPPVIKIPGRTFPVEAREEPQSTVAAEVVKAAPQYLDAEANGILVFDPGKREISDTIDEIKALLPPEIAKKAIILPFHAKMSPAEQQAAIRSYPGLKIIVSSNVAQTSLTIPDIGCVIDSGLERRVEIDENGDEGLALHPVSQADLDQRKGRTGRVGPGEYVLTRLNSRTPFVDRESRGKYPIPEILRTDIVRNALRIIAAGIDIAEFDLCHAPDKKMIDKALTTLKALGALDKEGLLTSLGRQMNEYPMKAPLGRMMVEAKRYSLQTQAYMAAMASAIEVGSLPYFSYDSNNRWKDLTEETSSDMLAQLDIFIAIQGMSEKELAEYDLDVNNVDRANKLYEKVSYRQRSYQEVLLPPTLEEREDLKRCIFAGFAESIFMYSGDGTYTEIGGKGVPRAISNRSLVRGVHTAIVGNRYRVELTRRGSPEPVVKHIVECVTTASLADLGRLAARFSDWRDAGFAMRAGRFVERREQYVLGTNLGITEETIAAPSARLREAILSHVLDNPGSQQRELRSIKGQLEALAHKAKDPVQQLTQDALLTLLDRATPLDVTDPTIVDHNLRLIMQAEGISLESFVSLERQLRIYENAPETIEVGNTTLKIKYQNGKAVAHHYRASDIFELSEDVFLPDGRHVKFEYGRGGKFYTLLELHDLILAVS